MWPIDEYLEELEAVGKSPGTISRRAYYLGRFANSNPDPWAVTRRDVLRALRTVAAPETKKSYRASLRMFYKWAIKEGLTDMDPTESLDAITVPRAVPRPCPDEVIDKVASTDPDVMLMIDLALGLGLRRAEVAGLHSRDIADGTVRIHGKGAGVRLLPLPDDLARRLEQRPAGWVFPSPYGGHLKPDTVGKKMSTALGDGWSAHTLRHRFASLGYAGTRDLRSVQEALGHSSPTTTARYVALPSDGLRSVVDAAATGRLRAA